MARIVALYLRISKDPQGRQEGVKAQDVWGRAYATEHWPGVPVEVFVDNDLSAASEDVHRPGFEALREAIRAGQVAHLWTVEQSRLTRVETVWFHLVADLIRAGISEVHTNRDGIVKLDDVVGGIKAVLSAEEVRKLKKRVRDALGERAAQGRPHGTNSQTFGYRNVDAESYARQREWKAAEWDARQRGEDLEQWRKQHPRPAGQPLIDEHGRGRLEKVDDEAAAIEWAASKILAGWSLASIGRELDRRGLRTAKGGPFSRSQNVLTIVTNHTVVGERVHHGRVVKGTWPAILDRATWRNVRAVLNSDRVVLRGDGTTLAVTAKNPNGAFDRRREYLLSGGIAVCGHCEANLTGSIQPSGDRQVHRYRCPRPGCGGTYIDADPFEDLVVGQLFEKLDDPEFVAAVFEDDYADRREEINGQLREIDAERLWLADRLAERRIEPAQFDVLNDAVADRARRLATDLAALPVPTVDIDPDEIVASWDHFTLGDKRAAARRCIDRVVVVRRIRRPTLDDVAANAGVSRSAVWRAVNGRDSDISDDSARAIRAVAADMGYQPGHYRGVFDPERVSIEWRLRDGG